MDFFAQMIQRHDTEANWSAHSSYIPAMGEIVIFDPDNLNPEPKIKIGDGKTKVLDLPFCYHAYILETVNFSMGLTKQQIQEIVSQCVDGNSPLVIVDQDSSASGTPMRRVATMVYLLKSNASISKPDKMVICSSNWSGGGLITFYRDEYNLETAAHTQSKFHSQMTTRTDGKVDAYKADRDGNGNIIADTYLNKDYDTFVQFVTKEESSGSSNLPFAAKMDFSEFKEQVKYNYATKEELPDITGLLNEETADQNYIKKSDYTEQTMEVEFEDGTIKTYQVLAKEV